MKARLVASADVTFSFAEALSPGVGSVPAEAAATGAALRTSRIINEAAVSLRTIARLP